MPFAILYGLVVWIRNFFYDKGLLSSLPFSLPIISVGNLSVGGTGKTPQVDYLISLLKYKYHVATLSRGYKRQTRGFLIANAETNARHIGDEPMQYFLKHPEVAVSVCEDRLMAIPNLLQRKTYIQTILLDDAFQHRSVKASLQLLITDVNNLYTKDYILPFGRLREFRSEAKRADIIIASKCDADYTPEEAIIVKQQLKPLPHQKIFFSSIQYGEAYDMFSQAPITIRDASVVLVTGIANNKPIVQHLKKGNNTVHTLQFPDHFYYATNDIVDIAETIANVELQNKMVLTTEKDATRLALHQELIQKLGLQIFVLPITISFLFNETDAFNDLILQHVAKYYPALEWDNKNIEYEEIE